MGKRREKTGGEKGVKRIREKEVKRRGKKRGEEKGKEGVKRG